MARAVALIPARSGSERVPDKNIRKLGEHPLIAYSIAAAHESKVFDAVVVSTDSSAYAEVAKYYGAEVPFLRPSELAGSRSPDIEWVEHMLRCLESSGRDFDCFSILRPTSPFRRAETIHRAWQQFLALDGIDSIRAVELCKQHPGKMWLVRGDNMAPLLPSPADPPWHSSQYPSLPEVHVQNASLEIAWSRVVQQGRSIAGERLAPFFTKDFEGFDVNDEADWFHAERLLADGSASLPPIPQTPYPKEIPCRN